MTTSKSVFYELFAIPTAVLLLSPAADMLCGEAQSSIAGIDFYGLQYDYDFKRVVKSIAENYTVSSDVDDGYISC